MTDRPLGGALAWLLAAWLLPGLGCAAGLLWLFEGSPGGLALHALLLVALLQTLLLPALPDLLNGRWPRALRWLVALLLASVQFLLLAFYAGSAAGQRQWGNWLTLDLALAYLPQLPALLRVLEVPVAWVVLGALAAWAALLWLYLGRVRAVALAREAQAALVPQRLGLLLLLALLAALMWLYRGWWTEWEFWRAEPLRQASLSTGLWGEGGLKGSVSPERLQRDRAAAEAFRQQLRSQALTGTPPQTRPLVLIIVDALRSDLMGVYGAPVDNTPFLDAKLREGTMRRVDDVYSVCTASYCGILGTLASRHWFELTPQPWNIADALAQVGYESRFLLSGDHSSFFGLRRMFGSSVARVHDGSDQRLRYTNDDRLVLDALDAQGWPRGRPGFLYIHLMSAHRLGELAPELKRWDSDNAPAFSRYARLDRREHPERRARYHNGIRQADAMIEQIFGRLQRLGVLDEALVVVTADHGEHLGEMGLWSHGRPPHEPGVRIPLLVYDRKGPPSFAARRLVSQTDIAPTLLRAIGAPVPPSWSGLPLQQAQERSDLILESAEVTGLVHDAGDGRYKYLRWRTTGVEELFRIDAAGAGESDNLARRPEQAERLQALRAEHERLRAR